MIRVHLSSFRLGTAFYERGILIKWRGKWRVLLGNQEGANTVVVTYIDTEMNSSVIGSFRDALEADSWIARRQQEGVQGSWHIDRLIDPATWDSKS